MAALIVTIDPTRLLQELRITMNDVLLQRLCELLQAEPSITEDWLVCKVAQFRGLPESDVLAMLYETDRRI
jgi:hypothetical protein